QAALDQVGERLLVLLQLELAHPEERRGRPVLGLLDGHLPELAARLGVAVEVVEDRAEREAAVRPAGAQLEGPLVEVAGLVELLRSVRGLGTLGEAVERRGPT